MSYEVRGYQTLLLGVRIYLVAVLDDLDINADLSRVNWRRICNYGSDIGKFIAVQALVEGECTLEGVKWWFVWKKIVFWFDRLWNKCTRLGGWFFGRKICEINFSNWSELFNMLRWCSLKKNYILVQEIKKIIIKWSRLQNYILNHAKILKVY